MALEQIPGSDQQILALEDEAVMRAAAHAAVSFLGEDHEMTKRMVDYAREATKAGSAGQYRETVVLWDEEARLVAEAIDSVYRGVSSHVDRINGENVVHRWPYEMRIAAARILGLADPSGEELEIIKAEEVVTMNAVDEIGPRHDSTTATWVTGLLAKLHLVKLGNQSG